MGNVLPAASPANGRGNYRARQRPVSETQGPGVTPIPPRGEAVRVVASSYEQVPSGWELPVRLAGLSAKGAHRGANNYELAGADALSLVIV